MKTAISQKPKHSDQIWFSLYAMAAAFLTYTSMYAFRKPFTAGMYEGLDLFGIDYKIVLITTQVMGYMMSKFIGIRVVSGMEAGRRIVYILGLIGIAWASLLLFGMIGHPWNFIAMFFNGLPLGMIWGLIFAYLEGRKNTELLGAGMSASFIVSSGIVKSVGKFLILEWGVSEFWMPFLTGLIFIPLLLLGSWMLSKMPSPDSEDKQLRTERVPMNKKERRDFFRAFAPGIILTTLIYIALTIIRDLRDNFAVEIWAGLGFGENSTILAVSEVPIAISVLIITAFMILIKNNRIAFYANLGIIFTGGLLLILMTALFGAKIISPAVWMIAIGFGLYLAYVAYHTMLFERWIALFRIKSNIGYLMYIADAFGYLGSVAILFYKNFFVTDLNWVQFIIYTAYIVGGFTLLLTMLSYAYFRFSEKRIQLALKKQN